MPSAAKAISTAGIDQQLPCRSRHMAAGILQIFSAYRPSPLPVLDHAAYREDQGTGKAMFLAAFTPSLDLELVGDMLDLLGKLVCEIRGAQWIGLLGP